MARYPERVRLATDLTRYDWRLTEGQLGWTNPNSRAQWGVIVQYDCGAVLDTLWKSLDVLEEETNQRRAETAYRDLDSLVRELLRSGQTAQQIRKHVTETAREHQKHEPSPAG